MKKAPSKRALSAFIILFITIFTLCGGFWILSNGIRFDRLVFADIRIQGLYLKLNNKFILEIKELDLTQAMSKKPSADSTLDLQAVSDYVKYALWGLAYFEDLRIEKITLSEEYVASIIYDGKHYALSFPKLQAIFDVENVENAISLDIKKMQVLEPEVEISGRILYASTSGQFSFGLVLAPLVQHIDSSEIESTLIETSKQEEMRTTDAENSTSIHNFTDIESHLEDASIPKLFVQGSSDFKRLLIKAKTSALTELDFARELVKSNAKPLLPTLDMWLFKALKFDTMMIEKAEFDITLKEKQFLKTLLHNTKLTLKAKNPSYLLDTSLSPFSATSATIQLQKAKATLTMDKPRLDSTALDGSYIEFELVEPTLRIFAHSNALAYNKAMRDLLGFYGVVLPIDSVRGDIRGDVAIHIPFQPETHIGFDGKIEAKNAIISSGGLDFNTKGAQVAININPTQNSSNTQSRNQNKSSTQTGANDIEIYTQNTSYENLFNIDTKTHINLEQKQLKTSLFVHSLRVSTNPDINQKIIKTKGAAPKQSNNTQQKIHNNTRQIQAIKSSIYGEKLLDSSTLSFNVLAQNLVSNLTPNPTHTPNHTQELMRFTTQDFTLSNFIDTKPFIPSAMVLEAAHFASILESIPPESSSSKPKPAQIPQSNLSAQEQAAQDSQNNAPESNSPQTPQSQGDKNQEGDKTQNDNTHDKDSTHIDMQKLIDSAPLSSPAKPKAQSPSINTPQAPQSNAPQSATDTQTPQTQEPQSRTPQTQNPQDSSTPTLSKPDVSHAPNEEILRFGEPDELETQPSKQESLDAILQDENWDIDNPIIQAPQTPQEPNKNDKENSLDSNSPDMSSKPESNIPDSKADSTLDPKKADSTDSSASSQNDSKDDSQTDSAMDSNKAESTTTPSTDTQDSVQTTAQDTQDTDSQESQDSSAQSHSNNPQTRIHRINGVELDFSRPMTHAQKIEKIKAILQKQDEAKFTYDIFKATQENLPQIDIAIDFADNPMRISIPALDVYMNIFDNEIQANILNFSKFAPFSPIMQYLGLSSGSASFAMQGAKDLRFMVKIDNFPSFLLSKDKQPLKNFTFKGSYANDKLAVRSSDGLIGLEMYDNTIIAHCKDIDVSLDGLLNSKIPAIQEAFSTSSEKKAVFTKQEILYESDFLRAKRRYEREHNIKPRIIAIEAQNITGYFKEVTIPLDDFNAKIRDDRISADATYKNGIANIDIIHGNTLIKAGNFSGEFLNRVIGRKIVEGGLFELNGIYKDDIFNGDVYMQNTSFKGFAIVQNVIALIDTIPSLVMFRSPALSSKGYEVKKGDIRLAINPQYVGLESIHLIGKSMDIEGSGIIELDTQEVDMGLSISTLKNLSGILNKIPIVGYLLLGKDGKVTTQVGLRGTLQDPKTQISLAQDILKTPLNVIKRAFKPVDMVIDEIIKSVDR